MDQLKPNGSHNPNSFQNTNEKSGDSVPGEPQDLTQFDRETPGISSPIGLRDANSLLQSIQDAFNARDQALQKELPNIVKQTLKNVILEMQATEQQKQQTQITQPLTAMQMEAPPTQTQNNGGGGAGAIVQAIPQLMQLFGQQNTQTQMQEQLMATVIQSGLRNMTLGGDFLNAITQMVAKNLGGNLAAKVSSEIATPPTPA